MVKSRSSANPSPQRAGDLPLTGAEIGLQYKISAIFIFLGTLLAAIVNVGIQFFIDKVRPDIILGVVDLKSPSILHKFLPSASFPSDHAAISMGIAFSSIVW